MSELNPYEAPQSVPPKRDAVQQPFRPESNLFPRILVLSCCQALAADLTVACGYAEHRAALVFGGFYFLLTIGLLILAALKRDEILFFSELLLLVIPLALMANVLMEVWPEL